MEKPKNPNDRAQHDESPRLKPYVKPAFRKERVFETMALACGKVSATQATCRTNRRNS